MVFLWFSYGFPHHLNPLQSSGLPNAMAASTTTIVPLICAASRAFSQDLGNVFLKRLSHHSFLDLDIGYVYFNREINYFYGHFQ